MNLSVSTQHNSISRYIFPVGQVYTCGKGIGILGHGDSYIRTVPKLVDRLVVSEFNNDMVPL